ncbi:MAG: polyvinylalcohol dehydrogenase, partial [Rubripirellula sp.]
MILRILFICLITSLLCQTSTWAENWPAWRGADRTDVSTETGLLSEWPEKGPELAWLSKKCGVGYAGFAV